MPARLPRPPPAMPARPAAVPPLRSLRPFRVSAHRSILLAILLVSRGFGQAGPGELPAGDETRPPDRAFTALHFRPPRPNLLCNRWGGSLGSGYATRHRSPRVAAGHRGPRAALRGRHHLARSRLARRGGGGRGVAHRPLRPALRMGRAAPVGPARPPPPGPLTPRTRRPEKRPRARRRSG